MPGSDAVDRAVELLRQTANYHYFFDQLQSAEWIEPLYERGFFRNPPGTIRDGDYVRFPIWVESRFLVRVAAAAPDLTVRILRELPETENTRVHEDVVDGACQVPAPLAASLAPRVVAFLNAPYQFLLPEKVKDLILHLARGGELSAAVDLARALLWPVRPESRKSGEFVLPVDPRPRFSYPEYEDVLSEIVSSIREVAPVTAYRLSTDLLDAALSRDDVDGDRSEDFSYIWRPAIEDNPLNARHPDMRNDLVVEVRDLADAMESEIRYVIEDLEQRKWPVFRRLALHLLRLHAGELPDILRGRALETGRLREPDQYHEFVLLLREALPALTDDDRDSVLERITSAYRTEDGADTPDQERRNDYWLARTLSALEPALPPRGQQLLEQLRSKLELTAEAIESPEFLTSSSGGVWVGPTSPLSTEDVLGTPNAELLRFLASWSPPEDWRAPSPEGLGRSLQEAVKKAPDRFAAVAPDLAGLDATYVRAALQGFREAAREGGRIDWAPVLQLGMWLLSQDDPEPTDGRDHDRDPDWSWSRRALADLLSEGLVISDRAVPFDQRKVVWNLLSRLVEDPDPSPEHEDQYGGSNMDPVTLAINTVRGEALHALVRYALWVRHSLGEDAQGGFDVMPEARDALEHHLDRHLDPSLAVRSAYGQFFPWLHFVDPSWAESRVSAIFPTEPEASAWFDAAWDAYIVFTQPFDEMAETLRAVYAEATERLLRTSRDNLSRRDPGARLAEHLAVFVARGALSIDDPLVARFFEVAPPELRGHLHQFLGQSFGLGAEPDDAVRRSMALWDKRLAAVSASEGDEPPKELESFGQWFAASDVDSRWRVTNLLEVLRRTGGRIDCASSVLEELAGLAEEFPAEALVAAQQIVRGAVQGWEIVAGREHIRAILATGLRAGTATRERAEAFTHELGARGYSEFRSVLEQP